MTETQFQLIDSMRKNGVSWGDIGRQYNTEKNVIRNRYLRWQKRCTKKDVNTNNVSSDSTNNNYFPSDSLQSQSSQTHAIDNLDLEQIKSWDLPAWVKYLKSAQAIHDAINPVTTQISLTLPDNKPVAIMFASCWHIGSRFVMYDKFESMMRLILDTDRLYMVGFGDEYDNFGNWFRSAQAVFSQVIPPHIQRYVVKQIVKSLADKKKLLAAFWSNHTGGFDESRLGESLIKEVYRECHVPYFDGKGTLSIQVGTQKYIIYGAHEFSGNSQWNKNHAQNKALHFELPSADVVAMGDKHTAGVQKVWHHIPEYDAGLRESPYSWLVQTGTAKAGNDEYSIRGWVRGLFEWPVLVFRPDEHGVRLCEDEKDLKWMLE